MNFFSFFQVPSGIAIIVVAVGSIAIITKKYLEYMKDHNQNPDVPYPVHQFNNIIENRSLMTSYHSIFIMLIMLMSYIPVWTISDRNLVENPYLVPLRETPLQLTGGLFIPIIFFILNDTARKHVKLHFWEWAPDFLQRLNPDGVFEVNI